MAAYNFDGYLDKIKVTSKVINIDNENLPSFLDDYFYFHPRSCSDYAIFRTFLKDMSDAIYFDIEDAVTSVPRDTASQSGSHERYQYGGYGSTCSREERVKREDVLESIREVDTCFLNVEYLVNEYRRKNTDFLISNYVFAMEFIRETVEMLLNPTEMQERAFAHLFYTFGRMVGLQIKDGAREAARDVQLLGEPVSSQPSMRVHVPWDDEHWWRQRPVKGETYNVTTKQPISAIVEVRVSPPEEVNDILKQVEPVLEQVVQNMLAELLSSQPVVDKGRLTMLAMIVLSTKVFFVILEITPELLSLYKSTPPAGAFDQWDEKKGEVYVTKSLDFMKHNDRHALIQILHKIGTISAVL